MRFIHTLRLFAAKLTLKISQVLSRFICEVKFHFFYARSMQFIHFRIDGRRAQFKIHEYG
jgi:hypothetical protein